MQNYCLGLNNHSDLRCFYYSFSYTGTLIGLYALLRTLKDLRILSILTYT